MRRIKDEVMKAAVADFNNGMRIPDVCKKYNISESAVLRMHPADGFAAGIIFFLNRL
jgi:hypothetical protein